jgi:protein-S-isoprenylcysteine O-methyltransferase Ste14
MLSLNARAGISLGVLALVMGLLLFVPAGTVRYWQAWTYLTVFFAASAGITAYLAKRDQALLARRMTGGPTAEKQTSQKIIMSLAGLGFIALLAGSGLDFRVEGASAPPVVVALGDVLTVVGFSVIYLVYRENTFTSATIEVAKDQTVVSTGPYAVVRHPMYAGGLLYLIGTPLALGSYWGLAALGLIIPAIIWRLLDEEQFLAKSLPGYDAYRAKRRWRLIPGIF